MTFETVSVSETFEAIAGDSGGVSGVAFSSRHTSFPQQAAMAFMFVQVVGTSLKARHLMRCANRGVANNSNWARTDDTQE